VTSLKLIISKIKDLIKRFFSVFFDFLKKFNFFNFKKSANGNEQIELDKKLVLSLSKSRIPSFKQLKYIKKYLNSGEIWLLRISFVIIILSLLFSGVFFYFNNLQTVAAQGGEYIEGLVGSPKYINPLYSSVSDVDNDISRFIYSSLFKRGKNGELVKDLAESYEIDKDSKIYTFSIKSGVRWHDGNNLTVDDIVFTFNAIKNKEYKSTLRNSFIGVDIEKIDDRKIKFILSDPYAAFFEILTFGILPSDIWAQIPPETAMLAELNLKPIGSGLYKFEKLVKEKAGNIREYYLAINKDYYDQEPNVNLVFKFFSDFDEAVLALNNNLIDGISYLPQDYKKEIVSPNTINFYKLFLPQLTLIFFNQQNNPALADKSVRQALAYSVDRGEIINNVLEGNAYVVDSPILPNSFAYYNDIKKYDYNPAKAGELLESVDWKILETTEEDVREAEASLNGEEGLESETEEGEKEEKSLSEALMKQAEITLSLGKGKWRKKDNDYLVLRLITVERNENEQIVEAIKGYWEAVGVKTIVEVFPITEIRDKIIKDRNFDTLFYGQVVGSDPDPYAFWHSSQTGENGFNIANFTNKDIDQLLEDARTISNIEERREKYKQFQEIISEEMPAMFLYSPIYTYIQGNNLKGFDVKNIYLPRDRFANINEWYIKVERKLIWPEKESAQ